MPFALCCCRCWAAVGTAKLVIACTAQATDGPTRKIPASSTHATYVNAVFVLDDEILELY